MFLRCGSLVNPQPLAETLTRSWADKVVSCPTGMSRNAQEGADTPLYKPSEPLVPELHASIRNRLWSGWRASALGHCESALLCLQLNPVHSTQGIQGLAAPQRSPWTRAKAGLKPGTGGVIDAIVLKRLQAAVDLARHCLAPTGAAHQQDKDGGWGFFT